MARFRCRVCGEEGTVVYDGRHDCPNCNSPNVQFALSIEELSLDDRPAVELAEIPAKPNYIIEI